ncbi:NADH:flavin oxidoreductase/NADH oxidase [Dyella sp. M7H15-1]|uniref:NADH:flavin oxidoreductase/NADH oxidase n=1 Tax=Dyella sp. M7H15-1 TaxID=2501295 RepID=UPI001004F150|nr:NADH:flavin oxidoreductase/NADH oxidase [Dyella sp. M7H15-1]QAU23093.1 NADH:flavin oxidoreductase/NADH oxidase [Dyella sp. M7H15-1]
MKLFEPYSQRSVTLRNRIVISPMCQYSAVDGVPNHWHFTHLGSRAVGGAGAVIAEATAVSPEGRISAYDTGIWNDAQREAWRPIAAFIEAQGAVAGVQLGHAGRKASVFRPWEGGGSLGADQGAWRTVAPSAIPFDAHWHMPQALDAEGIRKVIADFRAAALRAQQAGFKLIELHGAHGYLLHQFLSPLSNHRHDEYGGGFEHRTRLVREVIAAVREVWPVELPLWLRISATDWADGGWSIDESVRLAGELGAWGVDLVDVSSGGLVPHVKIPVGSGYQVPFAARIRQEASIATGAVGLITEPAQADGIIAGGAADVVLIARASLRDPYFPHRAAQELGASMHAPEQYQRAW